MSKRNRVKADLFPRDTKSKSISDQSSPSPVEGFFAGLRSLAHRVESEVADMGQQIEELQLNPNHSDDDGIRAKHFMLLARKEMQNLKSSVKDIHEDLKMRSSTVVTASELFTSLLESYSDRLESVESFMEQYGYMRPELQVGEEDSLTDASDENEVLESPDDPTTRSTITVKNEAENEFSTPPSSACKGKQQDILRTPRLQDFGLSEYTLSLYTRNCAAEQSNTFIDKFHPPDKATDPQTPDQTLKQHCNLSTDRIHTPVCSELTVVSNFSSKSKPLEIRTPQPEDFGLTDHILLRERQKIDFEKTVYLGNADKTVTDMDSQYYKRPHSARKNLDITCFQNNFEDEKSIYQNEQNVPYDDNVTLNEDLGKENIAYVQSPKTPEMPTLSATFWETSDKYSAKVLVESTASSVTNLPGTPKCQTLYGRDTPSREQDIPEVSLLDGVDRTPQLPVLFSFK